MNEIAQSKNSKLFEKSPLSSKTLKKPDNYYMVNKSVQHIEGNNIHINLQKV